MRVAPERIAELLVPYVTQRVGMDLLEKLERYLQLLQHWNGKVNLTAIRNPETMVERHFGESLFVAAKLPTFTTLLDIGSGAGFPGLPIAMARPESRATLAESQTKKAAFLREAVWMVHPSASVWADRVEQMPAERTFDVVTLRAVDDMSAALQAAMKRLRSGSTLAYFAAERGSIELPEAKWSNVQTLSVPKSPGRLVLATLAEFHGEHPDLGQVDSRSLQPT